MLVWHCGGLPKISKGNAADTDPVRSVCTAVVRCVPRSRATRSPKAARQSSMSGLAGLNTGDVWQSKPVWERAANTRHHSTEEHHRHPDIYILGIILFCRLFIHTVESRFDRKLSNKWELHGSKCGSTCSVCGLYCYLQYLRKAVTGWAVDFQQELFTSPEKVKIMGTLASNWNKSIHGMYPLFSFSFCQKLIIIFFIIIIFYK